MNEENTTNPDYWRDIEIELEYCNQFYISFLTQGHEKEDSARKLMQLSSVESSPISGKLDIQLFDSVDALNGIIPNRLLLNFRGSSSKPENTAIKLRVRQLDSGDSIIIHTGQDEFEARIRVKISTRGGLQTVLEESITYKPRTYKLIWNENG
jgi:hypothetical protein